MYQSLPLATEPLFFVRKQPGLIDLLDLESQHIFTSCTIGDVTLQGIQLRAQFLPLLVGLLVLPALLVEASERIQGIQLFGDSQQRLLLMLAMDIDEGAPKLFEHTQGAQATVDVHPMATRSGEHAPKNQLRLVPTDDFL